MIKLLLILCLLCATGASAQERWNPVFSGNVQAMHVVSADTVYIAVPKAILRTTNGGVSWENYSETGLPAYYTDTVGMAPTTWSTYLTGVAISPSGDLYVGSYTTESNYVYTIISDGSVTRNGEDRKWAVSGGWGWSIAPMERMKFFGDRVGLQFSKIRMAPELGPLAPLIDFSIDDGNNWLYQDQYETPIWGFDDVSWSVPNKISIFGRDRIATSIDTGKTWTTDGIYIDGRLASFVEHLSNSISLAVAGDSLYRTTDAGATWVLISDTVHIQNISSNSTGTVMVAGVNYPHQYLLKSQDFGETWIQIPPITNEEIHIASDTTAYVLSNQSVYRLSAFALAVYRERQEIGATLRVWPNPGYSLITTSAPVQWTNAVGQVFYPAHEIFEGSSTYNVRELPKGVYLLRSIDSTAKAIVR